MVSSISVRSFSDIIMELINKIAKSHGLLIEIPEKEDQVELETLQEVDALHTLFNP